MTIRTTGRKYEADRPKPRYRASFDEVVDNLQKLLQLEDVIDLTKYLRPLICESLKGTKFKTEKDCVYNCVMVGQMGLNVQITIVDPDSSEDRSEEHFVLHFTGGKSKGLPENLKGKLTKSSDLSKIKMVTRRSLTLTLVGGISVKKKKEFGPLIGKEFAVEIND